MTPTDQAALDYLTAFLKRNPQILQVAYGAHATDEEMQELLDHATDPASWDMWGPRKPTVDDKDDRGRIGVYDEGVTPNQYVEPTNTVPGKTVALMRYFVDRNEMSDMGFNLLELKTGEFRVGMLADNWPE